MSACLHPSVNSTTAGVVDICRGHSGASKHFLNTPEELTNRENTSGANARPAGAGRHPPWLPPLRSPPSAPFSLPVFVSGVSIKLDSVRRRPVLPGKWRLPLVPRSPRRQRIRRRQRGLPRKLTARRIASLRPRRMCSLARGFEPQVPEDLARRSLAELREMLKRQERLLRNE